MNEDLEKALEQAVKESDIILKDEDLPSETLKRLKEIIENTKTGEPKEESNDKAK